MNPLLFIILAITLLAASGCACVREYEDLRAVLQWAELPPY